VVQLDVDRIVEPSGIEVEREIVRHPGAAVLLPVTSDGRVILIRQFRYAAGETLLEVPAGTIDPGETPEQTADASRRETGTMPAGLRSRGVLSSPGILAERMHLFLATELEKGEASPDTDESLEVVELSWEEALALEPGKDVRDAKTIVALSFLKRHPLFANTGTR
jgi:ADP-ribose pyrophosphatase